MNKLVNYILNLFDIEKEDEKIYYEFSFSKNEVEILKESVRQNCYTDCALNLLNKLNEIK